MVLNLLDKCCKAFLSYKKNDIVLIFASLPINKLKDTEFVRLPFVGLAEVV